MRLPVSSIGSVIPIRFALSLLLPLSCVASLAAQCPTPLPGFGAAGAGGTVRDFVTADLGSGPALYAGGEFSTIGNAVARGVARWNGQVWSALGDGIALNGTDRVNRLVALEYNGPKLCAVGLFSTAGGQAARGVALWDGQQWDVLSGGPTTGAGQNASLLAAAVFDDGSGPRLYVGGSVGDPEGGSTPFLARYDGATWAPVSGAPTSEPCDPEDYYCTTHGVITSLVTWNDSTGTKLHVGGNFEHVGGGAGFDYARFDGTSWSVPGGTLFSGEVDAMTLHDDGSGAQLYLSGVFSSAAPDPRILRWNGSTFSAPGVSPVTFAADLVSLSACSAGAAGLWLLPSGVTTLDSSVHAYRWDGTSWNAFLIPMSYTGDTYALEAFDGGQGPQLFIGGNFTRVGTATASDIARFDGAAWSALGSGLGITSEFNRPGYVSALCIHDDGSGPALYAGGQMAYSGGSVISDLVRWTGSTWQPMPGLTSPGSFYIDSMVSADVGQGTSLYVAGDLKVGGSNPAPFARWNGSGFDYVGLQSFTVNDMAAFDAGNGNKLYIATTASLFRFDNGSFSSVIFQGSSTNLRALCVYDDGSGPALYVGGSFAGLGGATSRGIVRWNGSTWSAVGAGLGANQNETVETLRVMHVGNATRLVAGGVFTTSGGTPLSNLAVWDGQTWSDLGGGVGGTNAHVYALEEFDDGQGEGRVIFVGGKFTSAGGLPAANLARWNGQSWSASSPGSIGNAPTVRALCTADLPALGGRTLSVGGDFEAIGSVPSQRYARLAPCVQTGVLECFGDGSSAACPCGNASPAGSQSGCLNSLGAGATLRAHGSASLTNDTLVLEGGSLPPSSGLYFQGAGVLNGGMGVAFGDGLRCASGPYRRLGSKSAINGTSSYPDLLAGDLLVSVKGSILAPATYHYQFWYRNSAAFCTPSTFNYTNAVAIVWGL